MDSLTEIVKKEVAWYANEGYNVILYPILDDVHQTYAINSIGHPNREEFSGITIMARVVGDKVIIEVDNTDRPLVDGLRHAGIPREQIILAYAGEAIPETET
jgi:XisI protein